VAQLGLGPTGEALTLFACIAFSWIVLRSRISSLFDAIAFLPHAVGGIGFSLGALLLALYVIGAVVPEWPCSHREAAGPKAGRTPTRGWGRGHPVDLPCSAQGRCFGLRMSAHQHSPASRGRPMPSR